MQSPPRMLLNNHYTAYLSYSRRSTPDPVDDASDENEYIAPTRTAQYAQQPSQLAAGTFRRRHARRHAAIYATPSVHPYGPDSEHFSTVTILGPESEPESVRPALRPDETLTRIVPTVTTPEWAPMSSVVLLQPSVPAVDLLQPSRRVGYKPYGTPVPGPQFPTDYPELETPLVTPTPSFKFVPVST